MSDTNKSSEWQKREVGALWKKESPTQKYFSGHIKVDDGMGGEELLKVVIFKNNYKEKDNHPDFRIYSVDDSRPQPSKEEASSEPALADEEVL